MLEIADAFSPVSNKNQDENEIEIELKNEKLIRIVAVKSDKK